MRGLRGTAAEPKEGCVAGLCRADRPLSRRSCRTFAWARPVLLQGYYPPKHIPEPPGGNEAEKMLIRMYNEAAASFPDW